MNIDKPTIVVVNGDRGFSETKSLTNDYELKRYHTDIGYVSRLVEDRAALVVVFAKIGDNWRFWTATPKSSPATRRIPMILVSDDATIREQGLASGADVVVTSQQWKSQAGKLVQDYARVRDVAEIEQLACDCEQALPELARQGIAQFNAGAYYQQHDLFEALWVDTDGPVRDLYRAILQVGVAYYQVTRGNHRGALKMLLRSVQWLALLPDTCQGVDVAQLKADSYRVRMELERLDETAMAEFDLTLLKPVRWVNQNT